MQQVSLVSLDILGLQAIFNNKITTFNQSFMKKLLTSEEIKIARTKNST